MTEPKHERATEEVIRDWIENLEGRFVLIGPADRVAEGCAFIYDTSRKMVCGIDENDTLHRDVVRRMLLAGARVLPKVPS